MDEIKLLSLIAGGENAQVEFKREIDLSTARNKAEFIKDLVALANSALDTAYLIVGVDDSKLLVGIDVLAEEQLQQVASTYITPVLQLSCSIVSLQSPPLLLGILEIRPGEKPHKAARGIEYVAQNKVFIRRGPVVFEATPEEVIRLHQEAQFNQKVGNFIHAAEIHKGLGNLDQAIIAYSDALQLAPSAELFAARGDVFAAYYQREKYRKGDEKWKQLAYKDYSDALSLSTFGDFEKKVRLSRWHVFAGQLYTEELDWLKSNLSDRNLGEALYIVIKDRSDYGTLFDVYDAVSRLDQIIELGYHEADVYALRAQAHYHDCNYGLALADIDTAIQMIGENSEILVEYYYLRASILCKTQSRDYSKANEPFKEAFKSIKEAKRLSPKSSESYVDIAFDFEREILWTYSLAYYAGNIRSNDGRLSIAKLILQHLAYWFGNITNTFPLIAPTIKILVGKEFWDANRSRLE